VSWPRERLGSVAELAREAVHPQSVPAGTRYVGLENISSDGVFSKAADVSPSELASTKFLFTERHILFGKLRPYLRKTVRPTFAGICSTDIIPIAPSSRVDRNYLFHFLRTDEVVERATSMASGANLPRISPRHLVEFEIPLPPFAEQLRIAAILDQADGLRRKRRETLVQLSKLGESLFSSTFVDAAEAREWPVWCVGDLATDMRTGPFGSQLLHSEFVDQGVAVIGIDNAVRNEFVWDKRRYITQAKYETLSRYRVRPGDLLITIMGTCGRCAVVPDDVPVAINTKHICCISLDQNVVVPSFLHAAFLQHPEILQQLGLEAKGAVMPGLNMGIVKALKLPIPPVHLQKKFAAALKLIADEKQRCRQSLDHQDALFASLQHRAFRGEL